MIDAVRAGARPPAAPLSSTADLSAITQPGVFTVAEIKIVAEQRTEFGKGAARRLRRDKKVPGVIYGHGENTQHVALPAHELMLALKNSNALMAIELPDGVELVLPKSVQRDPVRYTIEHVDLVAVKRGEKVTVEVPVHTEGKIAPGGLMEHVNDTITLEAEATHIPESLTISVEGLEVGQSLRASDVELPEGSSLAADPDMVVVHVLSAQIADEPEEETAEVEGGAEPTDATGEAEAPTED